MNCKLNMTGSMNIDIAQRKIESKLQNYLSKINPSY